MGSEKRRVGVLAALHALIPYVVWLDTDSSKLSSLAMPAGALLTCILSSITWHSIGTVFGYKNYKKRAASIATFLANCRGMMSESCYPFRSALTKVCLGFLFCSLSYSSHVFVTFCRTKRSKKLIELTKCVQVLIFLTLWTFFYSWSKNVAFLYILLSYNISYVFWFKHKHLKLLNNL